MLGRYPMHRPFPLILRNKHKQTIDLYLYDGDDGGVRNGPDFYCFGLKWHYKLRIKAYPELPT